MANFKTYFQNDPFMPSKVENLLDDCYEGVRERAYEIQMQILNSRRERGHRTSPMEAREIMLMLVWLTGGDILL